MKKSLYPVKIPATEEVFDLLLNHKNVKIERIISSDKITNKEYVQEQDEWVVLLKGHAKLDVDGKTMEMKEGDYLFIPSGQKHKASETKAGTVWLAVHIY